MSNPSSNSNIGDLFRQRRAAAASSSSSSTRLIPISSNIPSSGFGSSQPAVSQAPPPATSSGRKSFAEIQREQEIAQQHQKQQRQQQQQSNIQQQQRQQYNVVQRQSVDEYGRLVRPSAAGDRGSSNSYSRGDPRSYDGPRGGGGGGGDRYSSSGGGGSSRRGTNNSIHNSRDSHRSSLPTEQGVIHTLLDKFGFIRCADRPIEVFFHYSEYKEGHSDDLNIGDEVEFKIGKAEDRNRRTGDDKMSAFDVIRLPEGTVYWEKEDEPVGKRWRGIIDQSVREQRSSGGGPSRNSRNGPSSAAVDGVIRIVNEDDNEENSSEMNQLEIYYSSSDYSPTKNSNTGRITGPSRLDRKDIVEFTLVTERRTGKKYARSITLVQSERERQRIEHEAKLLANAKLEEGKVVTITRDFGFIQSSSRLEQVYFHESNILPLDNDENENGTSSIDMLKEGQDVQFYVIGNEGGKNGKSVSARKIKILPKGSVKFEHVLAQGVTGLVVECPIQAIVGFDRDRRGSGKSQQTTMGKIRLHNEIVGKNREGKEEEQVVITEVLLHPDMYPGGTFAISRTGSEVGCWIRPGDVLLFDVVQKVIDGSCHAMPTKSIQRRSSEANDDKSTSVKGDVECASTNNTTNKPCIHLIETTLCGRAQGIVRSIHDNNYGFIQLVERGVDAYFPLYEVFPSDIQADLARDNPALYHSDDLNNLIQSKGGRINIEVGMEVEFDLSLQMLTTQAVGGGGGRYKQQNSRGPVQGKESLRGRRVQILPKGSVKEKISVASEVKATVIKSGDAKHQYVGTLQLEESLKVDTVSKCHPLVARLLDGIIQGRYGSEDVVFHDVISERDAQIVITMVNANDDLEWDYIDEKSTGDGHNRKLCIKKKSIKGELENLTLGRVEASATSDGASVTEEVGNDDTKEATSPERKKQTHKSKKGSKKTKIVKTLRFEKYSFPDVTIDPLLVGDVLTCDIFQSRKSGSFLVENINVIERKERPVVVSESEGKSLGFVSEVVPSRHFGFITVVNAEGTKGEHVFFHFRDVNQSNKSGRKDVVMRGNEVQFDAAPGKNGKICATNITFLPQGTLKLPVKANNNSPSCTGYILIEPSHTSLVNTPSHALTMQNGPAAASAGGRWANVKDDKSTNDVSGSNVKEGGVILLLSDPSHLFTPKPPVVTDKDSEEGKSAGESNPTDSDETTKTDTKDVKRNALVGPMTHIRYNLSSLAPRGLSNGRSDPKRGDLVTFSKARGANLVKDIKVQKTADAISVKGSLTDIDIKHDTAALVTTMENNETKKYDISLSEVVSCEKTLLKDQEQCDGILYEGKIYGVCRTKDIYLASSFGGSSGGLKERPRLNLTVKKELGGQVMAQSKMAKGPDNTNGFVEGWTKRVSPYVAEEEEDSKSLNITAMEFVPTEILTSGLQSDS